jgi:2-iminobutanoate/2-iminopropanoate deaminase
MNVVSTENAPAAVGPYAQARIHGGLVLVSGQLPLDPVTGKIESQDPVLQLNQCLDNIAAIAEAAGTSLAESLKITILMTDMSAFADLNQSYATRFGAPYPARLAYQVAALPMGAKVEVDATIALS